MHDLSTKKVVQSNTLIKSIVKMDALPLKFFELAVANVDTKKSDPEVELEKDLIRTFLPKTNVLTHDYLRTIMTNLMDKSTFTVNYVKDNGVEKTEIFAPFSKIEFSDDETAVKLSFSNKIMPYITELKKNFTQYKIEDLQNFTSANTITIYKILMMYYNQYTNYRISNKKHRSDKDVEEFLNPVIKVHELREITRSTKKSYDKFSEFDRRVLKPAVKEINDNTDFTISYDKIRVGRKILKVQFHIKNNVNPKVLEADVKPKELSLQEVQSSQYTAMLVGAMLIGVLDATNEKLMMSLGKSVYPLYDKFVAKHSVQELQRHLAFVKEHMSEKPDDLASYLVKALENFENKAQEKPRTKAKAKGGQKLIQKEKLPEWVDNEELQKNRLTEKGKQTRKKVEEMLLKLDEN